MSNIPAISVRGASKFYRRQNVHALHQVSLEIARGEAFGIVGANGSGKSTLLKLICGILQPTTGSVDVNGRISALLELGSGFSPEFTGRDNVYLNASILGLSRAEIDERFPAIERFAEIGDFINQPVKTYSTGMVLRLAFAVSAHVDPDILVVDEALAVGDIAFRQRCMRRIHDLRARSTTIVFVSHDTSDVKALCDRCVWLNQGRIEAIGPAEDVVQRYMLATSRREAVLDHVSMPALPIAGAPLAGRHRTGDGRATITSASISAPHRDKQLQADDEALISIRFTVNALIASPIIGFLIRNAKGENYFGTNTARENYPVRSFRSGEDHLVEFRFTVPELPRAEYNISIGVADGDIDTWTLCDYLDDAVTFSVAGPRAGEYFGLKCVNVSVHKHN